MGIQLDTSERKPVQRVQYQGQFRIIGTIKAKYIQQNSPITRKCDAEKIVMYVIREERTGRIKPYTAAQTKELIKQYKFVNAEVTEDKVMNTECSMEKLFVFNSALKVVENFGMYIVSELVAGDSKKCIGYKVINSEGRTLDVRETDLMKPGVVLVNAFVANAEQSNRHVSAVKKEFTQTIVEMTDVSNRALAKKNEAEAWSFRIFDNKVATALMTVEQSVTPEIADAGDRTYRASQEDRKYYRITGLNKKVIRMWQRSGRKTNNSVAVKTSGGGMDTTRALVKLGARVSYRDDCSKISEGAAKRMLQLEEKYISNLVAKTGDAELLKVFKTGVLTKRVNLASHAIQLACIEAALLKNGISVTGGRFSNGNILIDTEYMEEVSVLGNSAATELGGTLICKAIRSHINSLLNARVHDVVNCGRWLGMSMSSLPSDNEEEMQRLKDIKGGNRVSTRPIKAELPDVGEYNNGKAFITLGYCLKDADVREVVTVDGRKFNLINLSNYVDDDRSYNKCLRCVGDVLSIVNINRWMTAYANNGELDSADGHRQVTVARDAAECLKHADIILAMATIYNPDLAVLLYNKVRSVVGTDYSFDVEAYRDLEMGLTDEDRLYYESGFNVQNACLDGTKTTKVYIDNYRNNTIDVFEYKISVTGRLRGCKRLNYRAMLQAGANIPVSDRLKAAVTMICSYATGEDVDMYIGSVRTL